MNSLEIRIESIYQNGSDGLAPAIGWGERELIAPEIPSLECEFSIIMFPSLVKLNWKAGHDSKEDFLSNVLSY